MNELKRIDPSVIIWPSHLQHPYQESFPELTGADWNALVYRVKALEANNCPDSNADLKKLTPKQYMEIRAKNPEQVGLSRNSHYYV